MFLALIEAEKTAFKVSYKIGNKHRFILAREGKKRKINCIVEQSRTGQGRAVTCQCRTGTGQGEGRDRAMQGGGKCVICNGETWGDQAG